MKEASLRKFHRSLGVIIALFLAVQVITGMVFALSKFGSPPLFRVPMWVYSLHLGGGEAGNLYRVILGLTILIQGGSGLVIFIRSRARMIKAKRGS